MIPKHISAFLWSYDRKKLSPRKDKKIIITNILNFGDKKAVSWLLKQYSKKEIKNAVSNTIKSEWDKKSLNFWSIILGIKPKNSRIFK